MGGEPLERDRADHQLSVEQQWQHLDAHVGFLHRGEGLVTKACGIAQFSVVDAQLHPREHLQFDLAEREASAGGLFHLGGNGVAVIIRVDQQGQRDGDANQQHQQRAERCQTDFQCFGHKPPFSKTNGP